MGLLVSAGSASGSAFEPDKQHSDAFLAETLAFDVLLNDRPIGRHTYDLVEGAGSLEVTSSVEMSVRLMFVEVFAYEHQAVERWRGNCLLSLESETRQNGRDEFVEARLTDNGFVINSATAASASGVDVTSDEACVGGYAYWDLDRLRRDRLLNAQKGVLDSVQLRDAGTASLSWRSGVVRAYELTTNDAVITLYYDDADQWLGLRTRQNGRWLEYRRADATG